MTKVIDGTLHGHRLNGIAGVANTGSDVNWTGHDFAQANWYAYGRLAWNPDLGAAEIADEWIAMTWGHSATDLVDDPIADARVTRDSTSTTRCRSACIT